MAKSKRGGKRKGAGRKEVEDKKIPITLWFRKSVIQKNYGEDKFKSIIYSNIECKDELLNLISEAYKKINFTDQVEEPYRENARQARKKLNKIAGIVNGFGCKAVTPSS